MALIKWFAHAEKQNKKHSIYLFKNSKVQHIKTQSVVFLYLLQQSLCIAKRVRLFQLLHFFDILWITEVRSIHFAFSCLLSTTTTLIFYNLFSILNFLIHMKQYISYLSFRCIIFSLPRFCLHFRHIRSHSRCRSRKIILMLSKFQIFSIFKFQLLSILTQK